MNDIKEILNTQPHELAQYQLKIVKKKTIKHFKLLISLIKDENFKEIEPLMEYSPSGDGHGCNNNYINFTEIFGEEYEDLSNVVDKMESLKRQSENNFKK